MKPSKVASAVAGDPSFFEGLVDAQAMSGSGHHHDIDMLVASSTAPATNGAA